MFITTITRDNSQPTCNTVHCVHCNAVFCSPVNQKDHDFAENKWTYLPAPLSPSTNGEQHFICEFDGFPEKQIFSISDQFCHNDPLWPNWTQLDPFDKFWPILTNFDPMTYLDMVTFFQLFSFHLVIRFFPFKLGLLLFNYKSSALVCQALIKVKLDGVGPVDNRPSTD